ncbi:unnamed protein product [Echinostoma caproni]|uniref:Uncharacterized protein n=1 Tax=Echinostoma caproni TaxID=27848 RepID=A0A183AKT8_9TREM|nr:unnamed protein product [Echinostoma caproni]
MISNMNQNNVFIRFGLLFLLISNLNAAPESLYPEEPELYKDELESELTKIREDEIESVQSRDDGGKKRSRSIVNAIRNFMHADVQTSSEDERLLDELLSVLYQFEGGIARLTHLFGCIYH